MSAAAIGAHECPRCGEPFSLDGCDCLSPWQRDLLAQLQEAEAVVLNVPHRQGVTAHREALTAASVPPETADGAAETGASRPVDLRCKSRFLCHDEGWITCEATAGDGHEPDFHAGRFHAWSDTDAEESEQFAAAYPERVPS